METLLIKEIKWNWRSFRYPAFMLVVLFFALLDPATVKYMNEILSLFVEGVDLSLFPEPTAVMALESALSDIAGIGILVLIIISMGSVAKEKETGAAAWILSKPVGRWSYLAAKVVVLYGVVIVGLALAATFSYLYTWTLLGPVPISGVFWSTVGLAAFALLIATITFTCSVICRSPLAAGGVSVLIFFLSGIFNMIIANLDAARFYPNTLLGQIGPLLAGAAGPVDIAWALAVTALLCIFLLVIAGFRFSRLEL
jgi:ABC-2 type transport system permease protein